VSIPKEIDVEGHAGFEPEHELEIMFDMEAAQLEFKSRDDSDDSSDQEDGPSDGAQASSPGATHHVRELPHHVSGQAKYYHNYYDKSPLARSVDDDDENGFEREGGPSYSYLHNNSQGTSSRDNSGSFNAYSGEEREKEPVPMMQASERVTVTRVPLSPPNRSNTEDSYSHKDHFNQGNHNLTKPTLSLSTANIHTHVHQPSSLPSSSTPSLVVRSKRGMSASVVESNKIISSSSSNSLDRERDRADRDRERYERGLAVLNGVRSNDSIAKEPTTAGGGGSSNHADRSNNSNHTVGNPPEKLIKVSSLKSSTPDFNQLVNRAAVLQIKRNEFMTKYSTSLGVSSSSNSNVNSGSSSNSNNLSMNNGGNNSSNANANANNNNNSPAPVNNNSGSAHSNLSNPINVGKEPTNANSNNSSNNSSNSSNSNSTASNINVKSPLRRPSSVESVHQSPRSTETLSGSNELHVQPHTSPRGIAKSMSSSPPSAGHSSASHEASTSPSSANASLAQSQDEEAASLPEQVAVLLQGNLEELAQDTGLFQSKHTVIREWFVFKAAQIVQKLNTVREWRVFLDWFGFLVLFCFVCFCLFFPFFPSFAFLHSDR
jgi:hypothetical protein